MNTENRVNACEAVMSDPLAVSVRKVATAANTVMVGDTVLAAEEAKAIFLRPATSALRTSLICQGYNFLIKNKAWRLFKRFFRFFST